MDENVPGHYSKLREIDWDEIKLQFTPPSRFINLIQFFQDFASRGEIPIQNILAAERSVRQTSQYSNRITVEGYQKLFDYLCAAIDFYNYVAVTHQSDGKASMSFDRVPLY